MNSTLGRISCFGSFKKLVGAAVLGIVVVGGWSVGQAQIDISNPLYGSKVTARLGEDGTLTISGTGRMNDFGTMPPPWYDSKGSITKVVVKNGVASIGNKAFKGCVNLTSVTLPNSVTSIGDYAFLGCANLTSITFPNSLTSIGNNAFENCNRLTSVTLPNMVTSIGNKAFFNLNTVTFMGNKVNANDIANAFS